MKLVKTIVRNSHVDAVRESLEKVGVIGMTISEVRGCGRQKGHKAVYRGAEYDITLLPKSMIDMVVEDDMVEKAMDAIISAARTGEVGDGKIFVLPVEIDLTIRTGEKAVAAVA